MFDLAPLIPGKAPQDTTVVVAMSGGVDSSVVAALLHKLGYKTIGITLQLWDYTPASDGGTKKFGTCCALDDVYDARRVCQTMGIPHYVLNYESEFKGAVIDDFVETYLAGATPIPCVRCNQRIKFDRLLEKAKLLGADILATGHYVRKVYGENGQPQMHKGLSPQKDQSYFLFTTTPEQLAFSAFPLGDYTKEETRALAAEFGLHVAEKKDSQDICFVPGGEYRKVVKKFAPEADAPGNIVDEQGKVLGTHDGIIGFTVGQRKGLGVAGGEPLYVVAIRPASREVVLGPRSSLATRTFTVKDLNWLDMPAEGDEVTVKVRNAHVGNLARVKHIDDGRVEVELYEAHDAVSPGQAAVFYRDSQVLGGGWIEVPQASGMSEPMKARVQFEVA